MNRSSARIESATAELYEDIHPYVDRDYIINVYLETIGKEESFFRGKKVLDCGFGGTGWGIGLFARAGAELVAGIDLNRKWVDQARERLLRYPVKLDLRQGSVLELPFADNTFDYVHSFGVMHHTLDWKKGLSEMARVAKPGGDIFVMMFAVYSFPGNFIRWTYRALGKIIPYRVMAALVKRTGFFRHSEMSILDAMYVPIEVHLTEAELRSHLASLGLTDIQFYESRKWKGRWFYKLLFGKRINHNVLAKKPG